MKKKITKSQKSAVSGPRVLPKAIEAYMPLVHSIASMVAGKGLPPNVQYDALVSDGAVGLLKAWERFDPNRGVKFETYASYRIRGEILDGLKNYSPVPYRVQVMVRDLAQLGYKKVVKSKLKKDEKLLEKKNLSESEFKQAVNKVKKIVAASALMYLLSLEDVRSKTEVTVAGERGPVDILEFKEMREKIRMSLKRLPELNQEVMDLFYNQGLNQKTIAKKMKLSRPKVCRIIDKSVRYLQKELKHH